MSLRSQFATLYAEAEARSSRGRRGEALKSLKGGAEIRVRAEGRRRQVVLGRRGAPVGEVEEQTFRRDGQIPPDAERAEYQCRDWHYVALSWEMPPLLFDHLPEEALPEGL